MKALFSKFIPREVWGDQQYEQSLLPVFFTRLGVWQLLKFKAEDPKVNKENFILNNYKIGW